MAGVHLKNKHHNNNNTTHRSDVHIQNKYHNKNTTHRSGGQGFVSQGHNSDEKNEGRHIWIFEHIWKFEHIWIFDFFESLSLFEYLSLFENLSIFEYLSIFEFCQLKIATIQTRKKENTDSVFTLLLSSSVGCCQVMFPLKCIWMYGSTIMKLKCQKKHPLFAYREMFLFQNSKEYGCFFSKMWNVPCIKFKIILFSEIALHTSSLPAHSKPGVIIRFSSVLFENQVQQIIRFSSVSFENQAQLQLLNNFLSTGDEQQPTFPKLRRWQRA